MNYPGNGRHGGILAALILVLALLAGTSEVRASYRYDVHFDAVQWDQLYFPADDFSVLSPGLIALEAFSTPTVPVVQFVTLNPPAELNGFEFDLFFCEMAKLTGEGYDLENLTGVALISPIQFDAPDNVLAGVVADINFDAGTYGPGAFPGDSFGRAVNFGGVMNYLNTTGTVTITYVPDAVVPAPGAILLGTLGAGLVGWLRRRRTL